MKVYTKCEYLWNKEKNCYDLLTSESYDYEGPIAYAGGGGGNDNGYVQLPPQTTTSVQKSEPWAPQQQYLLSGFERGKNLFLDNKPELYPNSMVVPFSPETDISLSLATQRALNGSPVQSSANKQLLNTLEGSYMDNPTIRGDNLYGGKGFDAAIDAALNTATNKVLPQIDSAFERSGRFNSGLAKTAQTQVLSDAVTNAFANQYGQERQLQEEAKAQERENQMRSLFFTPQSIAQDYTDYSMLASVGQEKENMERQKLAEKIYRYTYPDQIVKEQLLQYMPLISGNYGTTTTGNSTTTGLTAPITGQPQQKTNPIVAGLGGAATGFSVGGPWGAAIGGGLGLLSGFI